MLTGEQSRMHTLIAELMSGGPITAAELTDKLVAEGFGDVSAAQTAAEDEIADAVIANEVAHAYLTESLNLNRLTPHAKPEFEYEHLGPVLDFVNRKLIDHGAILHVYSDIMNEFRSGHRCSVCGRTRKQNTAISYDCAHEC